MADRDTSVTPADHSGGNATTGLVGVATVVTQLGTEVGAVPPYRAMLPTAEVSPPDPAGGPLRPGTIIDDFELLDVLGAGGFGQVFLARQRSLGRHVALKVTADRGHEAETLARLEHDHIVQVFSETVHPERDLRLLCMQYVPGATLERVIAGLRARPRAAWSGRAVLEIIDAASTSPAALDPAALRDREFLAGCDFVEAACWFGARLAEALAHAHRLGVLHRDVKPANVLLSRYGRPYLADFSVSAAARRAGGAAESPLGGTLSYMAPEHLEAFATRDPAARDAVDERADIYALGMVLYELFVGRLPFTPTVSRGGPQTEALAGMIAERRAGPPPLPGEVEIPTTVARLLRRCLEPRPEHRYPRAADLAQALDGCRELRHVEAGLPEPGPVTRLLQRWPFAAGCAFILLPHLLGSVVNVSYNALRIRLSPEQAASFPQLVLLYNAVTYPLCLLMMAAVILPVRSAWRQLGRSERPDAAAVAAARRRALRLPRWAIALSCLGWLPGGVLFPLGLRLRTGPVGTDLFGHFLVSFAVSGLIALTYSVLVVQFLTLRVLYPRFWVDAAGLRVTARAELRSVDRRLGVFQFLAVLIPLAGALMMIGVGPETFTPDEYRTFRLLVTGLIALGMTGLGVAILVVSRLRRTLDVFR